MPGLPRGQVNRGPDEGSYRNDRNHLENGGYTYATEATSSVGEVIAAMERQEAPKRGTESSGESYMRGGNA